MTKGNKNNNSSNEQLSGAGLNDKNPVIGKTELNNLAAISNADDDEPIMVVLDTDGYVHLAGQPRKPTAVECREWFQPGWQIITMPIKQFREANFKWIYDKPTTNDKR